MEQTDFTSDKNKRPSSGLKKMLMLTTLCVIAIAGLLYASYPKTNVVIGVNANFIDDDGRLKSYKKFQEILKKNGKDKLQNTGKEEKE